MTIMGYPRWQDFMPVLERAKAAADNQRLDIETLFRVNPEKSGGRPREDFHLARFAAFLVAMNGDPRKPEVAAAQAYFAIQTRVAESCPLQCHPDNKDPGLMSQTGVVAQEHQSVTCT